MFLWKHFLKIAIEAILYMIHSIMLNDTGEALGKKIFC